MEQTPTSNQSWTFEKIVKVIPPIVIGGSAVCFILGLLVVNLHLAKYGIYSRDFLRTEYILAGAMLVLLVVTAEVSMSYLVSGIRNIGTYWKAGKYSDLSGESIKVLIAVLVPLPMMLLVLNGNAEISFKSMLTPLTGICFAWSMFSALLTDRKKYIQRIFLVPQAKLHERMSEILIPIFLISGAISFFANATYPYISAAYGGGNRTAAIIFPNPRGMEVCKSLALPMQSTQIVGPIEILSESEKELTILVPNQINEQKIAIQLNKDLLDAIQTKTQYRYGK